MRRKLFIILFIFVFLLSNITPVFAAQTLELLKQKKNIIDGNIYEITYYSPDSKNNIPIIISRTESYGTVRGYRLAFYNKNTTWSYNSATKAWQASEPFYYKEFSTLDAAIESLFNNQTATDYTQATKFENFTYGAIIVYSQEEYSDEAASSLETAFYDWYTATTGEEPPLKGSSSGGNGELEDPGIFEILKAIYEAITHPRDTNFLVDVKEGLLNELHNNQFTNGILGITETILEIFNKDYTKPANFYRDNPFKLEINGIAMPSKNGGYWIDNRFNMELEPLNEKTMRWYFGDYPNLNGTYLMMDGKTPAVKRITDDLISAILWISLSVGLFKNLTRILDGDFASAGITKLKANREKERNTNKNEKTGKKGE